MPKIKSIKRYIRQVLAIVEKDLYLKLRAKTVIIMRFFNSLIQIFILIFVFGFIFNVQKRSSIGYWNASNFILFFFLAAIVYLFSPIMNRFTGLFLYEKYWKTLSAVLIAPVNRFILLCGVLISELVVISIPLIVLLIITWFLYPINFFFLFLVILIFLSIYLIFGSIGLFIGVYSISHEEIVPYFNMALRFLMLFSCISYPINIFPVFFQSIVFLNPLYYVIDLLRLTWYLGIDYESAILYIKPIHIISLVLLIIILPIFSLYMFEKIYKKHGITGY